MRTTSAKAVAAGIAGNLVIIATWLLSLIPGWDQVPDEPRAAIIALVSGGISAAIVYFAPANKAVSEPDPPLPLSIRGV